METEFFDETWIGKEISFTNPGSRWSLSEKLSDKNDQISEGWMKDFPGSINGAYGTFRCQNLDRSTEYAFMRITMQIPYAGAKPNTLAGQASRTLPSYGQKMLDAYEKLRERECTSVAHLLNAKSELQGPDDMIPGGSILYLLIEKAPGEQLDPDGFWKLGRAERQRIRQSFKAAWEECASKGFDPDGDVSRLFWDSRSGKITFFNLITASPATSDTKWSHIQWIAWGLAKAPDGYIWWSETKRYPDMSKWIL